MFSLEILKRIPRHWYVSAPELHAQLLDAGFERSLRSIERQLSALSEQFEIDRDTRAKPYGYRWKPNATGISVPMMSAQESVLLTLAERYLQNILPVSLTRSLEPHFMQAKRSLEQRDEKSFAVGKDWLGKVDFISPTQPLLAPTIPNYVVESVSTALHQNLWLTLSYENAAGYSAEYRVMPLALVQQDVRLYLVCQFEDYEDQRNLALHRMSNVAVQTLSFKRPKDFNLKQYLSDGQFGETSGERIKLSFRITEEAGKHLYETPLSEKQTIAVVPGYLDVVAELIDTEVLNRWLRSFGDAVSSIQKKVI